jgi:predicted DNA-binding transcriptional regulator AlpA
MDRSTNAVVNRTIISFEELQQKLGVSTRTARSLVCESWFPAPVQLGGGRVFRWFEDEVDEALRSRAPRRTVIVEPPQLKTARAGRSPLGERGTSP